VQSLQERLTRESVIENYAAREVASMKGLTIKIRFMRGWPDRIVLLRGGVIFFIEFKRPVGGKFEPLQERKHKLLRSFGFKVYVCNTKISVDEVLNSYRIKTVQ
jgi:hypothetical protein